MTSLASRFQVPLARFIPFVPIVLLLLTSLPAAAVDCADHDIDYPPVLGSLPNAPYVAEVCGIAMEGDYLYFSEQYGDPGFGGYPQLGIVDISNDALPVRLATLGPIQGLSASNAIAVDRQFVYGIGYFSISVINASNPMSPVVVGGFGGYMGYSYDLAIRPATPPNANNATLCVINTNSFRLYSLANHAAPSIIGSVAVSGDEVTVADDYAFVSSAHEDALFVIDIAGPSAPSLIITIPFLVSGYEVDEQAIDGDYLYVSSDGFVSVFDVSVPTAPAYLGRVNVFSWGPVAASGGLAYVPNGYTTAMVAVSASGTPHLIGTFPRGGYRHVVTGDRLYSAGNGLQVIDITDPQIAPLVGTLGLTNTAMNVAVDGTTAFIAGYADPPLLETIDISDPATPALLGSVDVLTQAWDVAIGGNHAFVACTDAMGVVDVSDPSMPELVASVPIPDRASAIALTGDVACVAARNAGFLIFDVSVPEAPSLAKTIDFFYEVEAVATAGEYAYLPVGGVLHIVDVVPPESASIITSIHAPGFASVIAVADELVYVIDYDSALRIIDVSDPYSPLILGRIEFSELTLDIAVHDQFVYATRWDEIIDVIDVSDPSAPVMVASTSTPGRCNNIAATDDLLVTAYWDFFTLPLQCPITASVGSFSAPPQVGWLKAFPNPTRGLTTIEMATQGPHAELRIYDLAGRLVRSLPSTSPGGARRAIVWDGRDHRGRPVVGGTYWLRLEDGVSVRTSKITVLR